MVQAAMAAAFLVGVTGAARAQAVISDDGGFVEWTIGMNGVSVAPGVSAVNLSGLGFFAGGGSGSWSNSYGVSVSASAAWSGGVYGTTLDSPTGTYTGTQFFASGDNGIDGGYAQPGSTGTAMMTLSSERGYFGALLDSQADSVNTLAFYNGATLVDSINITGLGTYIPNSINGAPDYASYLNVDFLGGVTYNKVVITESGGTVGHDNEISLAQISTSASAVSLTSLTSGQAPSPTPLPALGGTAMGLLVIAGGALRGLVRRRPNGA
jgi:hypothetical protein